MSEPSIVGLKPWLPQTLGRWRWWTEPVRAERLASFRIGLAAILLIDVLVTYLPQVDDFFGPKSLGGPEVFAGRRELPRWSWSLLSAVDDSWIFYGTIIIWAGAAACLLLGFWTRTSALIAWALSISVMNLNYYLHNAGDRVRVVELFYLMLCQSGAVWSLDHWWRRTKLKKDQDSRENQVSAGEPVFIHPWPLRLLFVQMAVIYFFSGFFKLMGSQWRSGTSLHYILADLGWTRFSHAHLPLPYWATRLLTWSVLIWEIGFPILVLSSITRTITLWIGVAFHVATAISLELGTFPLYMLCFYLPLIPWERYVDRWRRRKAG
ncbi:MAG: HTTM domain-containing protein [Candidatus Binatia bacterium]